MGAYYAAIVAAVAEDVGHSVFENPLPGTPYYDLEGQSGVQDGIQRIHFWTRRSCREVELLESRGYRQIFPVGRY